MKKLLFAIAFGAILVVGCKKEQEASQQPVLKTVTLRASGEAFDGVNLDGTTKGTMDTDGTFRWAAGDMIGVRLYKGEAYVGNDSGSGYNAWDGEFLLAAASAGNPSGVFTCTISLDEYVHWGYAAFYPKFDNNINNGDGRVYFELKKTYDNYTSGSCLMPMVANLNDPDNGGLNGRPSEMKLKHVGAGVRVTLKDVPAEANQASLTVTGKNIVNGTGNTAWYGVNPANAGADFISATDGTENTVYLKFATASEKRDITFIFPLPTVDLSGGIELKLYYNDGTDEHKEFWSRKASNLPALTRGQLLDMPDLTVPVTPEEAAAPIWIDGKISDWTKASNVTTYSTTSDRIVEWKYTTDSDNIYFLYKINKSKITTSSSSFNWDPYIYVGFDIDNDPSKGYNADGEVGGGMEYRAVIFPWRGPSSTVAECFIGVDENGHIDRMVADKSGEKQGNSKIGGKIDGDYCYVEVRIPFSTIGISSSTGYITVNHAMSYNPTGRQMIAIAGGPKPAIISAADQTVGAGQTVSIGATTNSTGTITYTSNDTSIATVDNSGVITGVTQGSTTITINVAEVSGEFVAATKTINVTVTSALAILINGDMGDWSEINALSLETDSRIKEWKFTSDNQFVYFYFALRRDRVDRGRKLRLGFDYDDSGSYNDTYNMKNCEILVECVPFTNEENASPVCVNGIVTDAKINGNITASAVKVWSDGAASGNIGLEVSVPRNMLPNLPASGVAFNIAASYNEYWTGFQSLSLK